LWQGLSSDYNSVSGYEYDFSDLKVRYKLLNSDSPLKTDVQKRESIGAAGPLTAQNFVDRYGQDAGMLIIASNFLDMLHATNPGSNLNAHRSIRGAKARTSINAGTLTGSGAAGNVGVSGARLQSGQLNSWQIFLRNTRGQYKGLGLGRNWIKVAAEDYRRLKN